MSSTVGECIEIFIRTEYTGSLIGISELVAFCEQKKSTVYLALEELEEQGKIEIVTRYFCPEGHNISNNSVPLCPDCDNLRYSSLDISILVYVKPTLIRKE